MNDAQIHKKHLNLHEFEPPPSAIRWPECFGAEKNMPNQGPNSIEKKPTEKPTEKTTENPLEIPYTEKKSKNG